MHWHKPIAVFYGDQYYGKRFPKNIRLNNRKTFGPVRNPWDWYVSFYTHQVNSHKKDGEFYQAYTTPKDDSFNIFIRNLLSQEYNKKIISKGFTPPGDPSGPKSPKAQILCSNDIGFCTYRVIYMFCKDALELFNLGIRSTYNINNWVSVSQIVKVENLKEEVINFLKYNCGIPLDRSAEIKLKGLDQRINSFKRKKPTYQSYYTPETRDLVYNKDKWIIDNFNYSF
jgi:hypothetical protein